MASLGGDKLVTLLRFCWGLHVVDIYVQYPKDARLSSMKKDGGYTFSLDGRRFFDVVITDRGVRVDSEATMGRRRYYYGEKVTLRFGRKHRPIVNTKGHPSKPIGFAENVFHV